MIIHKKLKHNLKKQAFVNHYQIVISSFMKQYKNIVTLYLIKIKKGLVIINNNYIRKNE